MSYHAYDREAAANYAQRWALDRNPRFPDFSNGGRNSGGGDCANFVSQCLHAGGRPMVEGMSWRSYSWWADTDDACRNWASARWLPDHLEEYRYARVCLPEDLDLGDLVTVNAYGGPIEHIMIISAKRCGEHGEELLYCSHSTNYLNHPLAEVVHRVNYKSFLYWKVGFRY